MFLERLIRLSCNNPVCTTMPRTCTDDKRAYCSSEHRVGMLKTVVANREQNVASSAIVTLRLTKLTATAPFRASDKSDECDLHREEVSQ